MSLPSYASLSNLPGFRANSEKGLGKNLRFFQLICPRQIKKLNHFRQDMRLPKIL